MKKTIFIGQAMPRVKSDLHDWSSLNQWLYSIGLNDELIKKYFFYSALVDYFPGVVNGTHVVPTRKNIEDERIRLKMTINNFRPELVVPVGRLSISYCLNKPVEPLKNRVGKKYFENPYLLYKRKLPIIPFPHPSGASTWRHNKENQKLLVKALKLLKIELLSKR